MMLSLRTPPGGNFRSRGAEGAVQRHMVGISNNAYTVH